MRVHNPLDKILNNEIKVKILRFLCRTDAEWTGRQIAREMKISPAAAHKALRELNNERVLLFRSVGKSYLYRLNKQKFIISELLKPLYKKEGKITDKVFGAIVRDIPSLATRKDIVSIAIFGSMKRKKEQATSDIDILVLVKNEEQKERIDEDLERVNKKIMARFGNTISSYLLSVKEFRLKYNKGSAVVRNIAKSHRLLFGKPLKEL